MVAGAAFVVAERRSAAPMLDLRLLRNPDFTAMLLAGALLSAAAWAGMTYQSLWLQSVLGLSAIKAGLVVLPCAASAFLVSGQVGRFLHRTSPRWMVGTGLLVIAVGALGPGGAAGELELAGGHPRPGAGGVGAGLAMASLTSTAMSAVPWQQAGMAGGALSAFRQLGYAFGIAVLGEVFRSGLTHGAGAGLAGGAQRRPGPGGAGPHARARPGGAPRVRGRPRPRLRRRRRLGLLAAVAVFILVRPRQAGRESAGLQKHPALRRDRLRGGSRAGLTCAGLTFRWPYWRGLPAPAPTRAARHRAGRR